MTKFQIYLLVSITAAIGVICRAFAFRPNFWSASILLAQSNGSLIILTNIALILTGGFVYALQRLLYGPLRPIEVEQLYEKGWMAVTETLLSLTIFREDIGTRFFIMFLSLMAGKIWEWIGEGRVEFLEQQPPSNPLLFHARLSSSLLLSVFFDCFMLGYCLRVILKEARPGMMVMYGFEYTILGVQSLSLLVRYGLTLAETAIVKQQTAQRIEARRVEIRQEREAARTQAIESGEEAPPLDNGPIEVDENEIDVPGWEEKGRWIFYLDLLTDFIKSIVYCGFFIILLVFHGLPIHIMRDLYLTVRSFCKRVMDFVQYRQATKNMNERYADATEEDLEGDNTCIICREEMSAWNPQQDQGPENRPMDERQRAKKLPCGHILHFNCLRSWLERQRVCPTCRRPVLETGGANNEGANGRNQQGRAQQNNDPLPGRAPQAGAQHQDHFDVRPAPPGQGQGLDQRQGQGRGHNQNQNQNQNQGRARPGNLRVFNLGPLRIALGAGPLNQAGELLNDMARQQQGHQNQQQPHQTVDHNQYNQQQPTALPAGPSPAQNLNGMAAANPQLIRQQVQHLSAQVRQLMYTLHAEHQQLDVMDRLVGEMMTIQNEQRNAQQPTMEHFRARDGEQPMGAQDPNLPAGMVLPPGYTLQRLHPVAQQQQHQPAPLQIPSTGVRTDGQILPSPSIQVQENSRSSSTAPAQTSSSVAPPPSTSNQQVDGDAGPSTTQNPSGSFKNDGLSQRPTGTASSESRTDGESSNGVRQRNPLAASVEDAEPEPTDS